MSRTKHHELARLSLLVRDGRAAGHRIRLDQGEVILGRGEGSDVVLPDIKMSRAHARIRRRRRKLFIEDLRSNNGTWLNDKRVRRAAIGDGDEIRLGKTTFEVVKSVFLADRSVPTESLDVTPTGETTGAHERGFLADLTPAKVEAMPTREFLKALGHIYDSNQTLATIDDEHLANLRYESRNFAIVYNIARALQEAIELPELLKTASTSVFKVTHAERCYVLLQNPETGELEPRLARHRDPQAGPIPLELSQAIVAQVMTERQAVISFDASDDPRFDTRESVLDLGMRSVLCAPILHGDDMLGILQLDRLTQAGGFDQADFELVTVIASLLALRIQNLRLLERQRQTIEALREAQDELVRKERLAVLGRLTSGLAHEIGNLLLPFGLAAELAAERPDDADLVEVLGLMDESRRRIMTLLQEVRLIGRGDVPELDVGSQDLRQTVDSVVHFARCDGRIRKHRIDVIENGELPDLRFDRGSLKQVLLNLLRNAAQALDAPSTIEVRLGLEDGAASDPEPMARIDVVDHGPGIPPERLARIWEPFFSTKAQGTGLGLDICRRIVARHGGHIACRSELGRGTTMTVLLPLSGPTGASQPTVDEGLRDSLGKS